MNINNYNLKYKMGIPSYFSYIIKNHPDIIKKLIKLGDIDNFYLDSNSIIYDCLRKQSKEYDGDDAKFEKSLLVNIEKQLKIYINIVKPKHMTYIAFDGVAPVAKLEQQRTRRYKSYLLGHISKNIDSKYKRTWDRTAITPGTNFMEKLGKFLTTRFKKNNNVIVSTSNEPGEGEHKIFQYIRDNKSHHSKTTTLIYGLDADLIMLCLNHLQLCKKIFLYRETPEFVKSIDASLEPNEHYFLDIPELGEKIISEMSGFRESNEIDMKNRLYDYILLAFFLGNDFLPHFPSMNIRTNGMNILLTAYRNTICTKGLNLTDGKNIFWGNLRKMIKWLADNEETNLKDEYKIRAKWEKRRYSKNTLEEQLKKLDNIPTQRRDTEKFIDPYSKYWQTRYYNKLFDSDVNKLFIKEICNNYMEGLEWVMNYYTNGCSDWHWYYKYHYPPLLDDLLSYIPHWDSVMIEDNTNKPVSPLTQLSYVLPRDSLHLLPDKIRTKLLSEYSNNYPNDCKIIWSFCKYFWEAHVDLPEINLDELTKIVMN